MALYPLASAAELQALLNNPKLVVLDVRSNLTDPEVGRRLYEAGHIVGARFCDLEEDAAGCKSGTNGRHPLPDSGRFCENMRRLGICPDSHVIVYDDGACGYASRLWFTLRWVGFENVQVLNGGLAAWQKAGLAMQTEKPVWEAGSLRAQAPLERVFDVEFIERNLETGDYVLLDGRSRERWAGQTEPIDPIAGHIPGALVRPSTENIGKDGLFKAPETLAEEFLAVINPASHADVINYCGSGVTACCNHLAMMIASIPAAGVYIGSWSEWISDARRPINQTDKP